jgi:hypothetical protein
MATKYSKWSWNITTFSISRPSKFYPNWDFWFENKPSGNPVHDQFQTKAFPKEKKIWHIMSDPLTLENFSGTSGQRNRVRVQRDSHHDQQDQVSNLLVFVVLD